jgi:hypothetical protein
MGHLAQYRRHAPCASTGVRAGMKRVKTVEAAFRLEISTTTGRTRSIQGVCQGVSSRNMRCMSTHRWTAVGAIGPKVSSDMAIVRALRAAGPDLSRPKRWLLCHRG